MRGVFVTGTGTEIGKTVAASLIARQARASGERVAVFKPAVSGLADYPSREESWGHARELPDHSLLRLASGSTQSDEEIAPYRYAPAVSPHLGAEMSGASIEPSRLLDAAFAAAERADLLVCEGVGGFLVPLTPKYLVRDLARDLALPLVLVASAELGTINHTLLTVEAARHAGLEIASIVLNRWPGPPGRVHRSNRETIAALTGVPVHTIGSLDLTAPGSWPRLRVPLEPPRASSLLRAA